MKLWQKYKAYPRWAQWLLLLLAAGLLIFLGSMLVPISADQTGLPDFAEETILAVSFGGNKPVISTEDPCFTDAELKAVWEAIPRLQNALEEATFYRRPLLVSPMCWFSNNGTWVEIETETGTYRIGTHHNRGFVEINGVRRYYRHHEERDRFGAQRAFWDEFYQLSYYFSEVNSAYYKALGN